MKIYIYTHTEFFLKNAENTGMNLDSFFNNFWDSWGGLFTRFDDDNHDIKKNACDNQSTECHRLLWTIDNKIRKSRRKYC